MIALALNLHYSLFTIHYPFFTIDDSAVDCTKKREL